MSIIPPSSLNKGKTGLMAGTTRKDLPRSRTEIREDQIKFCKQIAKADTIKTYVLVVSTESKPLMEGHPDQVNYLSISFGINGEQDVPVQKIRDFFFSIGEDLQLEKLTENNKNIP